MPVQPGEKRDHGQHDRQTAGDLGKSFADELAVSGGFASVRFVYSSSELKDMAYVVDGTLKKVIHRTSLEYPHEILVTFRAARMSDKTVFWEKEIGRTWKTPTNVSEGCGMGIQCQCVCGDEVHGAEADVGIRPGRE